ncbi:MAG: zinc ribbon domain-containing protein [Deltaproteobacteria bacterium]|nr:zinc ribbon domain-containing protein [Deltaproteobacteria bacterium]
MFFIIAGIQPKTKTLDDRLRMCPSCGLCQARLRRTDHYVSVFFLPLFRARKGTPFLECESCGGLSGEEGGSATGPMPACPKCGTPLERTFRFCPTCGRPLQ